MENAEFLYETAYLNRYDVTTDESQPSEVIW